MIGNGWGGEREAYADRILFCLTWFCKQRNEH